MYSMQKSLISLICKDFRNAKPNLMKIWVFLIHLYANCLYANVGYIQKTFRKFHTKVAYTGMQRKCFQEFVLNSTEVGFTASLESISMFHILRQRFAIICIIMLDNFFSSFVLLPNSAAPIDDNHDNSLINKQINIAPKARNKLMLSLFQI